MTSNELNPPKGRSAQTSNIVPCFSGSQVQKVVKTGIVLEKQLSRTFHGARDKLRGARDRKDETILYRTYIKMCSHSGIKFDLKA